MTLKRTGPIGRKAEMKRSRMRSKPVKQDWSDAESKRGPCRRCGRQDAQLAHTVGKEHQDVRVSAYRRWVNPNSVIPLCGPFGWDCHGRYDRRETGILDLLAWPELMNAGRACKRAGIDARRRLLGERA